MARTLILFLLFFSTLHVRAQSNSLLMQQIDDSSFTAIAQIETIMMKDSLLLNDMQLAKVDTVNRNYFKELGSMHKEGLDSDGRRVKVEGLNFSRMSLLRAILTDQQHQQYLGIIERRKQRVLHP